MRKWLDWRVQSNKSWENSKLCVALSCPSLRRLKRQWMAAFVKLVSPFWPPTVSHETLKFQSHALSCWTATKTLLNPCCYHQLLGRDLANFWWLWELPLCQKCWDLSLFSLLFNLVSKGLYTFALVYLFYFSKQCVKTLRRLFQTLKCVSPPLSI